MRRKDSVAIIGAGAVGTGVALALKSSGYRISAVVSRRRSSAKRLAALVRARRWGTTFDVLDPAISVFVISVTDTEIGSVAEELSRHLSRTRRARRVFHTSGASTSDLLRPLARLGMITCSIHPIYSFPTNRRELLRAGSLRDEWFGIEGPPKGVRWARSFVRSIGGRALVVPKAKKTLYHIACTFVANYPLTLLRAAEISARRAGLKRGLQPLSLLALNSLLNGLAYGPMDSLTGPVARGDAAMLRRHRAEIRKRAPELTKLFDALVRLTAREVQRTGKITETTRRSIDRATKR